MTLPTRREWLERAAGRPAPSPERERGQPPAASARPRVAPHEQLVNTLEFETEAQRVLDEETFRAVSGSDRAAFDRVTFRPRMMVSCVDLDLSIDCFGVRLFAPIIVGPVDDQRRFHADGELGTVRGAALAKAAVVVSAGASQPIEALAAQATSPLFYQVVIDDGAARAKAQAAERAGCNAVLVTVGAPGRASQKSGQIDWPAIEALTRAVSVPVVVKGITTAQAASEAVRRGASGLVVSTYGRPEAPGQPAALDLIAPVADAVGGRVPVLVDGGFRRGTDVMKALALGASSRP